MVLTSGENCESTTLLHYDETPLDLSKKGKISDSNSSDDGPRWRYPHSDSKIVKRSLMTTMDSCGDLTEDGEDSYYKERRTPPESRIGIWVRPAEDMLIKENIAGKEYDEYNMSEHNRSRSPMIEDSLHYPDNVKEPPVRVVSHSPPSVEKLSLQSSSRFPLPPAKIYLLPNSHHPVIYHSKVPSNTTVYQDTRRDDSSSLANHRNQSYRGRSRSPNDPHGVENLSQHRTIYHYEQYARGHSPTRPSQSVSPEGMEVSPTSPSRSYQVRQYQDDRSSISPEYNMEPKEYDSHVEVVARSPLDSGISSPNDFSNKPSPTSFSSSSPETLRESSSPESEEGDASKSMNPKSYKKKMMKRYRKYL